MAAPSWVQSGAGVVVATGSGTPTLPSGAVAAGDLVIAHILEDGNSTGPTLVSTANIEALDGTDNSMTFLVNTCVGLSCVAEQWIYLGRCIAGGVTTSITVSTPGDDLYMMLHQFTDVAAGTEAVSVREGQGDSVGDTAAVNDQGVTTLGDDRLAIQLVAINDDNAMGSFTGESGGDWLEAAEFASATGTDGCIQLQIATMAAAGTIDGGSFTMAAADPWGVIGMALKPVVAAAAPGPAFPHRHASRRALQRR